MYSDWYPRYTSKGRRYGTSRLWVISGGICSPFVTWKRRMSTLKDLHRFGQSFESHRPQQWHISWQLQCHGVPEVSPIIQKFEEQLWEKTKHVSKHAKKCKNYQERVAKTIKNHQESLCHGEHTWHVKSPGIAGLLPPPGWKITSLSTQPQVNQPSISMVLWWCEGFMDPMMSIYIYISCI